MKENIKKNKCYSDIELKDLKNALEYVKKEMKSKKKSKLKKVA